MSKKRQRMQMFGEAEKRKLRPPPEPWSLKDRLLVFGAFASALLVFALSPFLSMNIRHKNSIERRVNYWKREYGLSDSEALRLKEIESSFHRLNLLGGTKAHTPEQLAEHDQQIAAQMNPESARKFIANQKIRKKDH
jgi:hypothetical protein